MKPSDDLCFAERIKPSHVADAIVVANEQHFAQDAGGRLYHYRNGVYQPDGAEVVRFACKTLLQEAKRPEKWSKTLSESTVEYVRIGTVRLWDRPPMDRINLLNGILDLRTRELTPHTPTFFSSVQVPINFDPIAKCPAWERQLADTFPSDAIAAELPWRIIAYLLVPTRAAQKAILLVGPGGSGKSRFLAAIVAALGKSNVSVLSLQTLENNRFASVGLIGKLANVCADLPSTELDTTAVFKQIVGGDPIPAEYKHGAAFDFTPFARLVFSANVAPMSKDASEAFFDRWIVIPFDHVFRGTAAQRNTDELDAELSTASELSGVLNRALSVLDDVVLNQIREPASSIRARAEFQETTDPVAVWLAANTVCEPTAMVAKNMLAASYNVAAIARGRPPISTKAFGRALLQHRRGIREGQRGRERAEHWIGIRLREHTTSVTDSPQLTSIIVEREI